MRQDICPFNGIALANLRQFQNYQAAYRAILDNRYAYEMALIQHGDLSLRGLCPLTQRPTAFRTVWDKEVCSPDWRNQQVSSNGLSMAGRALIHYAVSKSRDRLENAFMLTRSLTAVEQLRAFSSRVQHADKSDYTETLFAGRAYDAVLVMDCFENIENIDEAIRGIAESSKSGGQILLSVPFRYLDEDSRFSDGSWSFGWDIVDKLNGNGFCNAAAITYWSAEFGYLGPHNMLIEAYKA